MDEPERNATRQAGLPPAIWRELGLRLVHELHGGFQSRVFLAEGHHGRVIVKLTAADDTDTAFRSRLELTHQAAEINPAVVAPLVVRSELTTTIEGWIAVCFPFVEGTNPDTAAQSDVEEMAATLAGLHRALATLNSSRLPPVDPLRVAADGLDDARPIHGDYAASNLIATPTGLRIIDFADCGTGSIEYELGNSLYMVLFDTWHADRHEHYQRFRTWFLDAYCHSTPSEIDTDRIDAAILVRARALERWLADLSKAPSGIRNATPRWHDRLHSFTAHVLGRTA